MTATAVPETEAPARASVTSRASAWLAVGAAILAVVLAPPSPGDLLPPGVLGTVVEGQLEQLVDGTWRVASPGDLVAEGAQVRTVEAGSAVRTRSGIIELAPGSEGRLATTAIELEAGSLLLADDGPVEVRAADVEARGRGTWRLDLGGSPRVGVYDGGVSVVDDSGISLSLGRFEQVALLEDALTQGSSAYRYQGSDPWDARMLGGAIAVDQQVARLETTLGARYGTVLQTADFYRDFVAVDETLVAALPGLARFQEGDRYGPPAATLVAVVVTELLTERTGLSGEAAVGEIQRLRRAGATWGLVLAHHDLGPASFREATDVALRRRQAEEAAGTAAPVATGDADSGINADEELRDEVDPTPPPSDGDEPRDDGSGPSEPSPPEQQDPVEQVGDTVQEVEDGVEESTDDVTELLEPLPEPPGTVEGVDDPLSDLLTP